MFPVISAMWNYKKWDDRFELTFSIYSVFLYKVQLITSGCLYFQVSGAGQLMILCFENWYGCWSQYLKVIWQVLPRKSYAESTIGEKTESLGYILRVRLCIAGIMGLCQFGARVTTENVTVFKSMVTSYIVVRFEFTTIHVILPVSCRSPISCKTVISSYMTVSFCGKE